MPEKPNMNVTRAEWRVLDVLLGQSPLSAREVHERLAAPRGSPQTTRTLIDRLAAKGALRRAEVHGVRVFTPAMRRGDVVREEARGFLGRFFDGRPGLCAAHFIEHEKLPPQELQRLKKLVDAKLREARHE